MNDKSWAFFGLTVMLAVLGFWAGMWHEQGVAVFCGFTAIFSGLISWAMCYYD